jgi:hypothetical protein
MMPLIIGIASNPEGLQNFHGFLWPARSVHVRMQSDLIRVRGGRTC